MSGVNTFESFRHIFSKRNAGPNTSHKCPIRYEKYPIFRTQPNLSLANLTSISLLLLSLLFLVVVHLPVVSTKILIISSGWWQAQALRQIHTANHLWHMYSSTLFKAIYVPIFMYTVIIWLLFWNKLYKSSSKPPNQNSYSQPHAHQNNSQKFPKNPVKLQEPKAERCGFLLVTYLVGGFNPSERY